MKTIRIAMVGTAVADGRLCAPFYEEPGLDAINVDYLFGVRHNRWEWETPRRRGMVLECALVDVVIDTLDPTDDGNPDELRLCEQAQKGDRS